MTMHKIIIIIIGDIINFMEISIYLNTVCCDTKDSYYAAISIFLYTDGGTYARITVSPPYPHHIHPNI